MHRGQIELTTGVLGNLIAACSSSAPDTPPAQRATCGAAFGRFTVPDAHMKIPYTMDKVIVDDWNSQLGAGRTGRALIEELSDLTGGRAFFPDSVYELEDICTKIAVELKNQYVIGYHSTNGAKDGKWRKLRVKVNPPKGIQRLNVRAKQGYYAPTTDAAPVTKH